MEGYVKAFLDDLDMKQVEDTATKAAEEAAAEYLKWVCKQFV